METEVRVVGSLAKAYHTVAKGSPQSEKDSARSLEAWRLHHVVMNALL